MCGLFCTLIENGIKLLNSYANLVKSCHKKKGMGFVTMKYSSLLGYRYWLEYSMKNCDK